jgi:hypothetical protein
MQSPTETLTTLRKLTIIVAPPGFILNLIHGIVSGKAFPALGLIPLAGSALLGASLLYRNKISYGGSPISLSPSNIIAVDFGLAALYFIFLIFSWIVVPHDGWDGGLVMLGTYGTVPLMVNVGCHGYFVWMELGQMMRHARDCPNPVHQHIGRSEYTPLAGGVKASVYEDEEDGSAV